MADLRRRLRVAVGPLGSAVSLARQFEQATRGVVAPDPARREVDPEVRDLALRTPWTIEAAERVVLAWRAHPGPETLDEYADAVMAADRGERPPSQAIFQLQPYHPPHRPGGRWHRHLADGRVEVIEYR